MKHGAPLVLSGLLVLAGCDGLTGGAGDRPEGFRLVQGKLVLPDEDILGRQVTGMQMAALHIDASGGVTAFPSDVFDPAALRAEAAFVVPVSADVDVVLVLQVPSASARGAGTFLGQFRFDGGQSLVPRGEDDLALGTVAVQLGARVPADTTLTAGAGSSPLAQTDSDGDGAANQSDTDDDDDGTPDDDDDDDSGDGVADAVQVLEALPDDDGDGVPDQLAE